MTDTPPATKNPLDPESMRIIIFVCLSVPLFAALMVVLVYLFGPWAGIPTPTKLEEIAQNAMTFLTATAFGGIVIFAVSRK